MFLNRPAMSTALLMLALAATLGTGCASVVEYQPRSTLVSDQGVEGARADLRRVLLSASEPPITSVDVTDHYVRIGYTQTHMGAFYTTSTSQVNVDVDFAGVSRLELYENHYVYIYRAGGSLHFKVLFPEGQSARTFIDLMASFKAAGR